MFEFVAFETIYVGKNKIYSKESPKIFLIQRIRRCSEPLFHCMIPGNI